MNAAVVSIHSAAAKNSDAKPEVLHHIDPKLIDESPTNQRKTYKGIEELAETMKGGRGVLQPIVVRAKGERDGRFELVFGHRRRRAAIVAKLETVPCFVRSYTNAEMVEVQLIENLQRDDITALEEAHGYKDLQTKGKSIRDIAEKIGKSHGWVGDRLKLLDLAAPALKALEQGKVSVAVAVMLGRYSDPAQQQKALEKVIPDFTDEGQMSVRDAKTALKWFDDDARRRAADAKLRASPKYKAQRARQKASTESFKKRHAADQAKWQEQRQKKDEEKKQVHAEGMKAFRELLRQPQKERDTAICFLLAKLVADCESEVLAVNGFKPRMSREKFVARLAELGPGKAARIALEVLVSDGLSDWNATRSDLWIVEPVKGKAAKVSKRSDKRAPKKKDR